MNDLHIAQLESHYHLPESALDQRPRLDRVLQELFDSYLELALEHIGIAPSDKLCIREVRVPVRLTLSMTDQTMAFEWAMAWADAVRHAIARGDARWVVHYKSRTHAMVDFAESVAKGQLQRAWAWQQLGFGEFEEHESVVLAAQRLVNLLIQEAACIVPVMRTIAERRMLTQLARQFTENNWLSLARAAVARLSTQAASSFTLSTFNDQTRLPRRASTIERSLNDSVIFQTSQSRDLLVGHDAVRLSLATLALIEVEPLIFQGGPDDIRETVSYAGTLIARTTPAVEPQQHSKSNTSCAASRHDVESTDVIASDPAAIKEPHAHEAHPPQRDREHSESLTSTGENSTPFENPRTAGTSTESETGFADAATDDDTLAKDTRCTGWSQMGGLLLLVPFVDELKLAAEIMREQLLCERPFRWCLHAIAVQLAAVEPNDAAALAFAGLGPTDEAPSARAAAPSTDEHAAITALCERIVSAARWRLDQAEPTARFHVEQMSDERLIDWICRRRARVVADPGWLQIHFSLNDVSTEIRRVGMDLDPGFVPWLGLVVKYVYE